MKAIDNRPVPRRLVTIMVGMALIAAVPSASAQTMPGSASGRATTATATAPVTDPVLAALLAEAMKNSPEILAARSEQQAAAQRIAPAGTLDDPMVEAGFLNVPSNSFSFRPEDMTMKMLGLSQRLPYPGKRNLRRDVAALDSESVAHAYAETVNRVLRDVRSSYVDVALASISTRLVELNRGTLQQLLKLADTRYAVGQGNQMDVLRAQTQLSKMSEELIRLDRERVSAHSELRRALGRTGPDASAPTLAPTLELPPAALDVDLLRERALQDRPQLQALKVIADRNQRSLELARRDQYPDFDVRLQYGQRDNMPNGVRRSDVVSVTVAMNLPVWQQTKTQPRIAEAAAMHEQASRLYEAQRNETAMRLQQQIAAAEQSYRTARLYRTEILPQARLTAEAAVSAYQAGRSDFGQMLDNQMAVLNFQVAEAAAIAGYNKALAEIDFLSGRPGAGDAAHDGR